MSQLKPSFVDEIYAALEASRFTKDDFKVELPKSGRVLLKISFLHKSDYLLSLSEEERQESFTVKQDYDFSSRTESRNYTEYLVRLVPGSFKIEGQVRLGDPGKVLKVIPEWCNNIRDDLYALAPKVDPLEQLREKLNSELEDLISDPSSFFTEEEMIRVDERFGVLFDSICELRDQYSITKQQLDELKREFEEFKRSARVYPKGTWAKITSNKSVKATGAIINSPEGRKFLFEHLRKAIGWSAD